MRDAKSYQYQKKHEFCDNGTVSAWVIVQKLSRLLVTIRWHILLYVRNRQLKVWVSASHCVKSVQIRSYFWSVFSRIWTEYGEIQRISPYSVRMPENVDHNSVFGHFSCSLSFNWFLPQEIGIFKKVTCIEKWSASNYLSNILSDAEDVVFIVTRYRNSAFFLGIDVRVWVWGIGGAGK